MSTWGLANTTPLIDFQDDPEDLIYRYLGGNWAITEPTHINKQSLFLTTDPAQMLNRPNPGNQPMWLWVQHFDLDSARNQFNSTVGRNGLIGHFHTFSIHIFTRRLSQGLTFPDLGIIARELERLIYQYTNQINGIQQFNTFRMLPMVESSDMGEAFTGMYRVTCQTQAKYEKLSTF
jgi:hypothetical protein